MGNDLGTVCLMLSKSPQGLAGNEPHHSAGQAGLQADLVRKRLVRPDHDCLLLPGFRSQDDGGEVEPGDRGG